jgi:hypothetical protein
MALGNQFTSAALGGTSFSTVYDDEQYPLGTLRVEPADEVVAANSTHAGDRVWIFVKITTAVAANLVVLHDASAGLFNGLIGGTTAAASVLGVTNHAIGTGKYGWVIRRGCAEATADGSSITAESAIMTAASGEVTDQTGSTEARIIGMAVDGVTSAVGTVYLTLP